MLRPRDILLLVMSLPLAGCGEALAPLPVGAGALSVGLTHVCTLLSDGQPVCWGSNMFAESGGPQPGSPWIVAPTHVPVSGKFTAISAGAQHSCGLTDQGKALCWGNSSAGVLGNAAATGYSAPVEVQTDVRFRAISAGERTTCALSQEGKAWCWGDPFFIGVTLPAARCPNGYSCAVPGPVDGDHTFVSLSVGRLHTCGLEASGTIYCWGENSAGELGTGDFVRRATPVQVQASLAFSVVDVALHQNTCAVSTSGETWCWGDNEAGQLGISSGPETCQVTACSSRPLRVATKPSFVTLSAEEALCGVSADARGYCWGVDYFGQMGDGGSLARRVDPREVPGNRSFSTLETNGSSTCGMTTGGEVYCWGAGDNGILGAGAGGPGLPASVTRPRRVEIK